MNSHIDHGAGGTMFAGAQAVEVFRLITLKSGIKLEACGIKAKRGQTCRSIARKQYGIKGNAARQVEQIDALIDQARAQVPEYHDGALVKPTELPALPEITHPIDFGAEPSG